MIISLYIFTAMRAANRGLASRAMSNAGLDRHQSQTKLLVFWFLSWAGLDLNIQRDMTFDCASLWEAWPSESHWGFNTFDETEQDSLFDLIYSLYCNDHRRGSERSTLISGLLESTSGQTGAAQPESTRPKLPPVRKPPGTPSQTARPYLPNPVTLHYPPFTKFLAPRNHRKS